MSVGHLGDVKYSILPPDKFRSRYGVSWIPLDGGAWAAANGIDLKKTDLATQLGIDSIPDGRGVFFRALNLGRSTAQGDPDDARQVGSYQGDDFKEHAHHYTRYNTKAGGASGNWSWQDNQRVQTEREGGAETRPRNIALYAYIKVDDD